jgi:effector-binding domain-containing protein
MNGLQEALRKLASQWRLLAAVALLGFFGIVYLERKLTQPPAPETETAAQKPAEPAPAGADKNGANESAVETPIESVTSEMVDVAARPVAVVKGQAKWDDAVKTLSDAVAKVNAVTAKAGLALNGRPFTVFTETDDSGFHYETMAPLAKAPEGKAKLSDGVDLGSSPAGKALKFQHRGSYDEIDATYEAITAYLDEKGLDTKNLFIEEYLTDLKTGDDGNGEVDIYVFVK